MPATSRLMKFIKDQGKFIELHSCGRNMQYVPEMIEMGIDMWTPQMRANDAEYLYNNFNKDMTFCFSLEIPHDWKEAEIRKAVRDFVDHYGENGRCMAWIMTDMSDPAHRRLQQRMSCTTILWSITTNCTTGVNRCFCLRR